MSEEENDVRKVQGGHGFRSIRNPISVEPPSEEDPEPESDEKKK
jgi:hypothetical protein